MSGLLERPVASPPNSGDPTSATKQYGGGRPADRPRAQRGEGWFARHRRSLAWLTPVLLIAGLVQAIGMAGAPQRIDDEGTYTAQAWALANLGEIAHYTYWYDHPPLGWLQMALYGQATFAFDRYDVAVVAMREAMLVAMVIAAGLLWALARKVGLSRPTASIVALIFAISPLAIQFHRTVYLDNVAVPWVIGAFLLAMTKRNQLAGFAGSAACFGVAVLSKETFLLLLPILAWVMWRGANQATRRYMLSVAASVLVLVGGTYLLLAGVKGELFPGPDRVSLSTGVGFQLATRESSGSAFESGSLLNDTLAMWLQLDPVILVAGLAAAVAAVVSTRMRPFAVVYLLLVATVFRPGGYTPVPFVIGLLPFAALLIGWAGQTAVLRVREHSVTAKTVGIAGIALGSIAAAIAAPVWFGQIRGLWLADLDQPLRQAQTWVEANVSRGDRLVVDDAMWVDLVEAGFPRENVIWYYKVDTDSDVQALLPNGWQDFDYIITTDSMRTFPDGFPQVSEGLDNATIVAQFGQGDQAVEVRRVHSEGAEVAEQAAGQAGAARLALGGQLATNPRLTLDTDATNLLASGGVDDSLTLALGQLLASHDLTVAAFPVVEGEDGTVRRQVLIESVDGTRVDTAAATQLTQWFTDLGGEYVPQTTTSTDGGLLVRYGVDR